MERIGDLGSFWPYYLNEHRSATSRRLHFVGTTGWLAACAWAAVWSSWFVLAYAGMVLIAFDATRREGRGRSPLHILVMLALPTLAAPVPFLSGVVWAYGCAWIGHFGIEKNRPATFEYPVWSLTCDLRMWSLMLRGKLWTGSDPAEQAGAVAAAA